MKNGYISQYGDQLIIKRYASSTIKSYLSQISLFLDFFKKSPKTISTQEIEAYIKELIQKNQISLSTQKSVLGTIKLFYKLVFNKEK